MILDILLYSQIQFPITDNDSDIPDLLDVILVSTDEPVVRIFMPA